MQVILNVPHFPVGQDAIERGVHAYKNITINLECRGCDETLDAHEPETQKCLFTQDTFSSAGGGPGSNWMVVQGFYLAITYQLDWFNKNVEHQLQTNMEWYFGGEVELSHIKESMKARARPMFIWYAADSDDIGNPPVGVNKYRHSILQLPVRNES